MNLLVKDKGDYYVNVQRVLSTTFATVFSSHHKSVDFFCTYYFSHNKFVVRSNKDLSNAASTYYLACRFKLLDT
jgi:ABC-type amino acid transport substrate-binding protein